MKYQLVLQFPDESSEGYDSMVALEDRLTGISSPNTTLMDTTRVQVR